MIGYFGDIYFEKSDELIRTPANFKINLAGRFAGHEVIGEKPVTEFTGPGLGQISFTIMLNGNHGVKPRAEMEDWLDKADNGVAAYLVLNHRPIGDNLWVVKSVSEAWDVIFSAGELFSGKVDVALEEYVAKVS